jgi:SAM-dependent methyltransferase
LLSLKNQIANGDKWRSALSAWAIPDAIISQAEESPWIHPPVLFDLPNEIEKSPSHEQALAALEVAGSVLDVGCGGGIAAFALVSKAKNVIGVDHQSEMLEMFAKNAERFAVSHQEILGFWPDVADSTPAADVVVSHHVAYNVSNIEEFLIGLSEKAKKRVVIEIPNQHPLSNLNELWQRFWQLERPSEPTADLLHEIAQDLGFAAKIEKWSGQMRGEVNIEQAAEFNRIRLCLSKSKYNEVLEFMKSHPPKTSRELATIWWDN